MKVYGLTGSIATGKTSVANLFKEMGIPVICADEIAHQVTQKGQPVLNQIKQHFGDIYINNDGTLNRQKLGALIFTNDEARKVLNSLIHPLVRSELKDQLASLANQKQAFTLLDIPLLFESGLQDLCEKVIVVYTPETLQLQRLMHRNQISQAEAQSRIRSQLDIEIKKKKADFVIDNSGDFENTKKQVTELNNIL